MNTLDSIVLVTLGFSALIGTWRGMTREVLGIGGWVVAGLVAYYGYPFVAPYLLPKVHLQWIADLASAGGLFFVSLIVCGFVTRSLATSIHESSLSGLDRSLGLVFGLLRGAVFVCIAFLGLSFFHKPGAPEPEFIKHSKTAPFLGKGAELLKRFLPSSTAVSLPAVHEVLPSATQHVTSLVTEAAIRQLAQPPLAQPTPMSVQLPTSEVSPDALATAANPSPSSDPSQKMDMELEQLFKDNEALED